MGDPIITNVDIGSVIFSDAKFRDELLKFAGIATVLEGTILARKDVADAVVAAAGTNTGNGTVTLVTVAGGETPQVGAYAFTMTAALIATLFDPQGRIVASNIAIADGAAIVLNIGGLQFTVTDGGTAFEADDTFSLTVAADGDMVPYAVDGVGGAQNPLAILTYDITSTGAQDIPFRAGVAGNYQKERLIIDADGDGSNITDTLLDELRNYGLVPVDVQELGILDNQ